MRRFAKHLTALFVISLFVALAVGCSGQQAASSGSTSSSGQPEEQTKEQLIAELVDISNKNDYKSVTMDVDGEVSVDYSALTGSSSESSDKSASSSASSKSADSEKSADAKGSDESSSKMTIPMKINAKCDISSGAVNMYMNMNSFGQNIELYVKGEEAIMVMGDQAVSATLQQLGMSDYASVDSILESQGANLAAFQDSVESIEKTTEGDETVYKVVCDPKKFIESNKSLSSTQQLGGDLDLKSIDITYNVNADGLMTGFDIKMKGKGYSSDIKSKMYDYNTTEVPDAPEATMSYSDMIGDAGTNADAEDAGSESAESASAESDNA